MIDGELERLSESPVGAGMSRARPTSLVSQNGRGPFWTRIATTAERTRHSRRHHQLGRQQVAVRATATMIEIYHRHRHRRLASHVRQFGRRRYSTEPSHNLPASHRAHLEWTSSRLIKWAGTISPAAAEVAEMFMLGRPHPEHGYRARPAVPGICAV